jgi:hypothetical protein
MSKSFNYVIARKMKGDRLSTYYIQGVGTVLFGPTSEATMFLKYVRKNDSEKGWKIYKIEVD